MALDQFLNPENSPFAINQGARMPYTFDYENERNAVSASHIKNFSFNQGAGGTLSLGGAGNGDGILSVQNSGGTEIVQINNTGITITGGSITIKDSAGSTIIDSLGLVSATSFTSSAGTQTGNQAITGTSFVDITNANITFSLARPALVQFFYSVETFLTEAIGTSEGDAGFFLNIGNPTLGTSDYASIALRTGNIQSKTLSNFELVTIPAGTTTCKVRARFGIVFRGTPVLNTAVTRLYYLSLGK